MFHLKAIVALRIHALILFRNTARGVFIITHQNELVIWTLLKSIHRASLSLLYCPRDINRQGWRQGGRLWTAEQVEVYIRRWEKDGGYWMYKKYERETGRGGDDEMRQSLVWSAKARRAGDTVLKVNWVQREREKKKKRRENGSKLVTTKGL